MYTRVSSGSHGLISPLYASHISFALQMSEHERRLSRVECRIVENGGVFVMGLVKHHGETAENFVVEDENGYLGVQKLSQKKATRFVFNRKEGDMWVLTNLAGREWFDSDGNNGVWNTMGSGAPLRVKYISAEQESRARSSRIDGIWLPDYR